MSSFSNKNVLITGASAGIGAALARQFAKEGANLVLTARRVDRLEALSLELGNEGRKVLALSCDVTKDGDMERVVQEVHRTLGTLDVVIANAGFGVVGNVTSLSLDDFRRQFETNIFGVLRTVKATSDDLRRTKGRLAVVGSVNGYVALPGNAPYAMSKFAVRALCDALYHELHEDGISVTHIAPGFVVSEIRGVDNQGKLHSQFHDPVPMWIQMPSDLAARKIVQAIYKRRRERVLTGHGFLAVWAARFFPGILALLMRLSGISARRQAK